MDKPTCSIPGCGRPVRNKLRGWCNSHYKQWLRHGAPLIKLKGGPKVGYRRQTPEERFWSKVNKDGPVPPHRPELGQCWVWMAATFPSGYGNFYVEGRFIHAHRYAWELLNGPIPAGLRGLHRCDNPPCVRLDHLFLGTDADNNADMMAKGRQVSPRHETCLRGHPFDEANTYQARSGDRTCRQCRRDRETTRRRAKE